MREVRGKVQRDRRAKLAGEVSAGRRGAGRAREVSAELIPWLAAWSLD